MEETVIEKVERPYTLRKLCANDIFPFCSIINRIGFKEFKDCFSYGDVLKMQDGGDIEAVGFDVVMKVASVVISNAESCQDSLYKFLSGLSGMTPEEIGQLDIDVFVGMMIDVVKKDEFKGFFKAASRFLK